MKGLKGKLKEDFEDYASCFDISGIIPLSMQFALLCDFLEGRELAVWLECYADAYDIHVYGFGEPIDISMPTKQEAIEKAIKYLNENYEH